MKILVLGLAALSLIACNKKESKKDDTSSAVTDSELSKYVGNWRKCQAVTSKGTDFPAGNSAYLIYPKVNANGTFEHSRYYYGDSANCTGSENIVSWVEEGTISIVRDSSSVTGAEEVMFDRTSSYVTARNINGKHLLDHFKVVFNPFNPPSMTVSNPTGIYLNNSPTVFMGDFEVNNGITYNTITINGSTMSMKEPLDWHMGQISAPASQGFDLIKQ